MEKTNYEKAQALLNQPISNNRTAGEVEAMATLANAYAQLAVADAINTLTETLKSFAVGESQGGRTLEVRARQ